MSLINKLFLHVYTFKKTVSFEYFEYFKYLFLVFKYSAIKGFIKT